MARDLIISVAPPAKMVLGSDIVGYRRLVIEGARVHKGFPPFPAAPDIMCSSQSRLFLGLNYFVPDTYREAVSEICTHFDPSVFRYTAYRPLKGFDASPERSSKEYCLEIVWAPNLADECIGAQLGEDIWFYSDENRIIAFGLTDIDDIMRDFNLAWPHPLPLPALEIDLGK